MLREALRVIFCCLVIRVLRDKPAGRLSPELQTRHGKRGPPLTLGGDESESHRTERRLGGHSCRSTCSRGGPLWGPKLPFEIKGSNVRYEEGRQIPVRPKSGSRSRAGENGSGLLRALRVTHWSCGRNCGDVTGGLRKASWKCHCRRVTPPSNLLCRSDSRCEYRLEPGSTDLDRFVADLDAEFVLNIIDDPEREGIGHTASPPGR